MKFGATAAEHEAAPKGGSGGTYMRYMKDGDTTFRILQEPDEWIYWYEHFNPGGFSFPCTRDRSTCPGCTSNIEKMQKASYKAGFNVLEGEYVNVYKVPITLAEKIKNRYERLGTITDREYTFTRYKTAGDKTDYDIEGGTPTKIDLSEYKDRIQEIEPMLEASYEEAWGDSNKAKASNTKAQDAEDVDKLREKVEQAQPQDPPSEPEADAKAEGEKEVSESYLRSLEHQELIDFLDQEGAEVPKDVRVQGVNEIVDYLLTQQ